uniref:Uncharacterized protein n=1 Tax=Candidatus Kentrum sp. DK TaxID=2126562 RepID=A0A450SS05_9GAMM|nr:MAG: hypothetical protein BECKDK2373C_GA0170839_105423 [Candidatus Kentron sp. DK]
MRFVLHRHPTPIPSTELVEINYPCNLILFLATCLLVSRPKRPVTLVQLILNPQAAISRVEYGARSMFPSD